MLFKILGVLVTQVMFAAETGKNNIYNFVYPLPSPLGVGLFLIQPYGMDRILNFSKIFDPPPIVGLKFTTFP